MEPSQSGKSFFQLMMKYFISSFCILFLAVFFVSSCILQGASRLGSTGDPDNSNTRPRIEVAQCGEKESCEWICDDTLVKGSERFRCYQISWTDVNRITNVYEVIMDRSSDPDFKYIRGDKSDLEKSITPSDFDFFLQHAKETLIQAFEDTAKSKNNHPLTETQRKENLKEFALWIAENEDIAKAMMDQDTSLEIGRSLFQSLGQALGVGSNDPDFDIDVNTRVDINNDNIQVGNRTLFTIDVKKEDFIQFLYGFIQDLDNNSNISGGDSLMIRSDLSRNDYAFEWGHTTLVDFCVEATNEDQDAIEVKKCLQAIYCIHRAAEYGRLSPSGVSSSSSRNNGIFGALDAYRDIVGSNRSDFCESDNLTSSNIDRYWD